MTGRFPLLAALGLFALAGCEATPMQGVQSHLAPVTAEAVHNYAFQTCSASIGAAERQKIHRFLGDLGLTRDDVLVVSVPKGRIPLRDQQRRATLDALFARYPAGVRYVQDRDLRELPRSEAAGVIRVVRTTGIRTACRPGDRLDGCTQAHNLSVMMAVPADGVLPTTGRRYRPRDGD